MNILIVEDNKDLGKALEVTLRCYDRRLADAAIGMLTVVEDLEHAITELPAADAVLCDGEFPINDRTGPAENWALVAYRATRLGIPTIVYSGSPTIVEKARSVGLVALGKPSPIEQVYGALVNRARDTGHGIRDTGKAA